MNSKRSNSRLLLVIALFGILSTHLISAQGENPQETTGAGDQSLSQDSTAPTGVETTGAQETSAAAAGEDGETTQTTGETIPGGAGDGETATSARELGAAETESTLEGTTAGAGGETAQSTGEPLTRAAGDTGTVTTAREPDTTGTVTTTPTEPSGGGASTPQHQEQALSSMPTSQPGSCEKLPPIKIITISTTYICTVTVCPSKTDDETKTNYTCDFEAFCYDERNPTESTTLTSITPTTPIDETKMNCTYNLTGLIQNERYPYNLTVVADRLRIAFSKVFTNATGIEVTVENGTVTARVPTDLTCDDLESILKFIIFGDGLEDTTSPSEGVQDSTTLGKPGSCEICPPIQINTTSATYNCTVSPCLIKIDRIYTYNITAFCQDERNPIDLRNYTWQDTRESPLTYNLTVVDDRLGIKLSKLLRNDSGNEVENDTVTARVSTDLTIHDVASTLKESLAQDTTSPSVCVQDSTTFGKSNSTDSCGTWPHMWASGISNTYNCNLSFCPNKTDTESTTSTLTTLCPPNDETKTNYTYDIAAFCQEKTNLSDLRNYTWQDTRESPLEYNSTVADERLRAKLIELLKASPGSRFRRQAHQRFEVNVGKDSIIVHVDKDLTWDDIESILKYMTSDKDLPPSEPTIQAALTPGAPVESTAQGIWGAHFGLFLTVIILISVCVVVTVVCCLCMKWRGRDRHPDKQPIAMEEAHPAPTAVSNPIPDHEMIQDEAPMQERENPAVTPNGGGQHISKADEDNGWVVPLDELSKAEKEKPEVENTRL